MVHTHSVQVQLKQLSMIKYLRFWKLSFARCWC